MTPGQEALIEAMRLEQARIYSQTCPEHVIHKRDPQDVLLSGSAPIDIRDARQRLRKGVA